VFPAIMGVNREPCETQTLDWRAGAGAVMMPAGLECPVRDDAMNSFPKNAWTLCWLMFFATALSFLDRQVLSVLAPSLMKELGMDNTDYARVVAAFTFSYMVMFTAGGWLVDRLGTRWGLALCIAVWSAASGAHGFAMSALGLGVARLFLGLGEGGCFPASTKGACEWFPAAKRALAIGIANGGSAFGAVLAPPMTAWLATEFGWRGAFFATGIMGVTWLIAWLVVTRSTKGATVFLSPSHPEQVEQHQALQLQKITALGASSDQATPPSLSPATPVEPRPKRVGGWLLLFCLGLTVFGPLITLGSLTALYSESSQFFHRFPGLLVITVVDTLLSLGLMVFGIYTGIGLWSIRAGAVRATKRYLLCVLGYSAVAAILPFMAGLPSAVNKAMVPLVVIGTIGSVISFAIWYSYLNKSRRVRATYGEQEMCYFLMDDSRVWRILAGRFFFDPVFYFYMFWIPKYLSDERGFSLKEIGNYTWIPFLALGISNIAAGQLSDLLVRRGWSPRKTRAWLLVIAALVTPVSACVIVAPSAAWAIGLMAVLMAAHGLWICNYLAHISDQFPSSVIATVVGLSGTVGGIAATIANLSTGPVVDAYGFTPIFICTGILYPLAAAILLVGRRSETKVEPCAESSLAS
jgi:MFS family permease